MPATPVEQIKEKLDIVEFIRGYMELTAAGRNFKGRCPFHKEKTPSFMVSPERQSWHCFGCGLGGDAFSFLMRYENIEFGEALRVLAERVGVELRRINPAEQQVTGILYDLQESAARWFREQLARAKPVQDYLRERGLAPSTIETFGLGWAPDSPDGLTAHFLQKGVAIDDLIRAGLTIKTERGLALDRFRGRVMFPIHNHLGKAVGFTGRIFPAFDRPGPSGYVPAKYVNSPETAIFNKSKILYGFWKTKDAVRESGSVFLVEGQMDFLMSWQSGVSNAAASSGTALTADHLRTLHRFADTLLLSFDNDEAGWAAGERAIELAEQLDWSVKVVTLPPDVKDPADVALKSPEQLKTLVVAAKPAIEVVSEHYLGNGRGLDFRNRDDLRRLRAVLAKISRLASAVEQARWLKNLAQRTALAEKILREEMDRVQSSAPASPSISNSTIDLPAEGPSRRLTRWEFLTEEFLGLARAEQKFPEITVEDMAPGYGIILDLIRKGSVKSDDVELDEKISRIILSARAAEPGELAAVKTELIKEKNKESRRRLIQAVRNAEAKNNSGELSAALFELAALPQDDPSKTESQNSAKPAAKKSWRPDKNRAAPEPADPLAQALADIPETELQEPWPEEHHALNDSWPVDAAPEPEPEPEENLGLVD